MMYISKNKGDISMNNMENFKEEKQYKVTVALKSGKYMDINVSIEERDSLIKLLKTVTLIHFHYFCK